MMCHAKKFLMSFILLFCCFSVLPSFANIQDDPSVKIFIAQLVKQHHFKKSYLKHLFSQVVFNPTVIKKMSKPYEAKPWYEYRRLFVNASRVTDGVKFWHNHLSALKRAKRQFGVPPSVIVALIGIETKYGEHTGDFRVIDSLATLAFKYPKRGAYFKKELTQFLLMTRENQLNPLTLLGSYAGAMGLPQFMPNSYRHYAIDFSGTGIVNIQTNVTDAIGSVANYLKVHGWSHGGKIALKGTLNNKSKKITRVKFGNKPRETIATLEKWGISPVQPVARKKLATVIKLHDKAAIEYWLGLHNFYVLTRYNRSKLYAMAVYELSHALLGAYDKTTQA